MDTAINVFESLRLHSLWIAGDLNGVMLNWSNRDLSYITLFDKSLHYAKLMGANLKFADLSHTSLEGASLENTNLESANLRDTKLMYANLKGANLRGANLKGANLKGTNLEGANLSYANLEGANLNGAVLWGAKFDNANLKNADFNGTIKSIVECSRQSSSINDVKPIELSKKSKKITQEPTMTNESMIANKATNNWAIYVIHGAMKTQTIEPTRYSKCGQYAFYTGTDGKEWRIHSSHWRPADTKLVKEKIEESERKESENVMLLAQSVVFTANKVKLAEERARLEEQLARNEDLIAICRYRNKQ